MRVALSHSWCLCPSRLEGQQVHPIHYGKAGVGVAEVVEPE